MKDIIIIYSIVLNILHKALSAASSKCLSYRNSDGYTPLHMACLADKPECVKALLVAGADVNISASQASAHSLSSSSAAPGYVGDFLHVNSKKLHTQVCLVFIVLHYGQLSIIWG
jgi:ankyrin repeat protein